MKKDDYNIEMLKFIRQEINNRVEIHYKMLLSKLAFSGAIFSFLHTKELIDLSPFFTSAMFSLSIDIIIVENLGWIRSAGSYLKHHIENSNQNIIKWERDFAQIGDKWICFSPIGYILGIWSFSVFWFIGGIIHLYNKQLGAMDIFGIIISILFIIYTLFLIFQNLSSPKIFNRNKQSPIN